jgi:hypothetical protein
MFVGQLDQAMTSVNVRSCQVRVLFPQCDRQRRCSGCPERCSWYPKRCSGREQDTPKLLQFKLVGGCACTKKTVKVAVKKEKLDEKLRERR